MTTVKVLTGPERRRRWTAAEKLQIVEESLSSGLSVAEFARRREIHPNLLHSWRGLMKAGELAAADGEARFVPVAVATPSNAPAMQESDSGDSVMVEVVLRPWLPTASRLQLARGDLQAEIGHAWPNSFFRLRI
jgi:transposase-like protein